MHPCVQTIMLDLDNAQGRQPSPLDEAVNQIKMMGSLVAIVIGRDQDYQFGRGLQNVW